ncbi:kazal-type serine protease inhibitor domain-containing protein 1 isoform X2 [Perognathus longimembris pacificus]|nr:kazal-type serine protease inhibitor domain-containing protein 1 isoform X2 [Perognathus longimembris pacificus]XP_048191174.1 kazal-type serine protease inhibitor domain-containing protein 1 isoform X2 [Perognathus longimembris pacificus]
MSRVRTGVPANHATAAWALRLLLLLLLPPTGARPSAGPGYLRRSWLRLLTEGEDCGPCRPELCAVPRGCLAGRVRDACDCCWECANLEGQLCDLDPSTHFYGRCGEQLECRMDAGGDLNRGEVPEPWCACRSQSPLCGSDGRTYAQICRLQEAARARPDANLTVAHPGPCESEPKIVSQPRDIWNVTGQDVIFGCEVFAYPMASIEWRKDSVDIQLPGDDPHISVQFRGGPQRFEVTGWLQIQAIRLGDEGTYRCIARNARGQAEASASLIVLTPEQLNSTGIPQLLSAHLAPEEEENEESYDYDFY